MPFCTRRDMESVTKMLGNSRSVEEILPPASAPDTQADYSKTPDQIFSQSESMAASETDSLPQHPLTLEVLQEHLRPAGTWGQREIERQTGINQSKISKYKNHITGRDDKEALDAHEKAPIYDLITGPDPEGRMVVGG